jgi:hypothetical protein
LSLCGTGARLVANVGGNDAISISNELEIAALVLAVFSALSLAARGRSGKLAIDQEIVCSQRQNVALAPSSSP